MADEDQRPEETPELEAEGSDPDFNKKHPLEYKWTLWFDNPQQKQSASKYGQSLRQVFSFDSVEDFWCLYNNIKTPGQLTPNATYYLFKEGIEPKWEDPKNAKGGAWTANIPTNKGDPKKVVDAWWLNAVLACIGEQFSESEEVHGIAVVIRGRGDRIEMWTRTASDEHAQTVVGKQLKQFLDIPDTVKIGYSVFEEKISNNKAKDRYMV